MSEINGVLPIILLIFTLIVPKLSARNYETFVVSEIFNNCNE
jgi:hypothetical protein